MEYKPWGTAMNPMYQLESKKETDMKKSSERSQYITPFQKGQPRFYVFSK